MATNVRGRTSTEASTNDEVILIPDVYETIDLCSQELPDTLVEFQPNEVIVIQDSPNVQSRHDATAKTNSRRNRKRKPAETSSSLNDSQETSSSQAPSKKTNFISVIMLNPLLPEMNCPICLESIVGRSPVSTNCGHIFCKSCLQTCLKTVKKCPMCQKILTGRSAYHNIFL